MDYEPLVGEKIEAGRQYLQACSKLGEILAACWIKESELSGWYLYVAMDGINDTNKLKGYGLILEPLRGEQSLYLSSRYVKLVSDTHPIVSEVNKLYSTYPATGDTWYQGPMFGGMGTDGVFIYAPSALNGSVATKANQKLAKKLKPMPKKRTVSKR